MLTNYYSNPKDRGKKNIIIEEMIKMDLDNNFILCGKVDKAYFSNDGNIEVLDYKTGQSSCPFEPLQLAIYLMLVKHRINKYPDTMSFYFLASNTKLVKEVTDDFVSESTKLVEDLYSQIKSENHFDSNPTIYCKDNCQFYDTCSEAQDSNLIALNSLEKANEIMMSDNLNLVF